MIIMTDNELEMVTKDYHLWLNWDDDNVTRKEWLENLDDTDAYVYQLNKECDLLRRNKYPTQEETIDALQETLDQRRKVKPEDPRGLDFYIRNMFVQNGTGKKDYFKHEQREICEQRVLNYNW